MAANKSVIVLAPNGRRQIVRVTINTTILQVLEEVCQKQGFNVDDYDIKHSRQILDPNTIFRFTGLPNNAQLEMIPCAKARSVSNVTISIQPENGERVMREFSPTATLAQILTELYPDSDLKRAVLIYMHREVYGKEILERTTLKSLGLSSGRAILRLMYRDPEQLKTQAHVSTPLVPKPDSSQSDKDRKSLLLMSYRNKAVDDATLSIERVSNMENEKILEGDGEMDRKNERINTSSDKETNACTTNQSVATSHSNREKDPNVTEACEAKVQEETKKNAYEIKFLGERGALVFNQAEARALPRDELPDSFFDLDLHDAKTLLRDAKRRREQLEDAPLLTETQRQLDRDKHTLDQLNKYRHTIIRIQFPDQFVLQGLFGLLETVQRVKDFVKNYLDNPECKFSLYTTPPKRILNSDARLLDENLVPSAIVYYSGQSSLKSSVKEKLTDPRAADIEAIKSRTATTRREQNPPAEDDRGAVVEDRNNRDNPGPSSYSKSSSQNKTPKWFKQTFQ